VEKNTDADIFRFNMLSTGRFKLDAIPYNVGTGNTGSDLDLQVTLYNNSQTILNIFNPGTLLSSVVDTTLGFGTYYLKVEGKGNLYAPNYASLGSYSLLGRSVPGAVLPVRRLELNGSLNGDKHELNWIIEADEQIIKQLLEISTDGRTFSPLTERSPEQRSYTYRPVNIESPQYRLNVLFDNGRQYYSNIITIRQNSSTPRPQLNGTLINTNTIAVSSPGVYEYMIIDMNGKVMALGKLVSGINLLQASGMANGIYMIRFANNTQQWTDKFIRQ
jgi:hypothetical protein